MVLGAHQERQAKHCNLVLRVRQAPREPFREPPVRKEVRANPCVRTKPKKDPARRLCLGCNHKEPRVHPGKLLSRAPLQVRPARLLSKPLRPVPRERRRGKLLNKALQARLVNPCARARRIRRRVTPQSLG